MDVMEKVINIPLHPFSDSLNDLSLTSQWKEVKKIFQIHMVQLVNGFYTTLQTLVLFSLKPLLIVKKKHGIELTSST